MFKLKSYPAQVVRHVGIYGEVTTKGDYNLFTIAKEELFIKFWFVQYTRLFEKYEETSKKLKKAHEDSATEKEFLQRKYLEELRQMKVDYEKEVHHLKLESMNLKQSFDEILLRREQEIEETLSEIESTRDIADIVETLSRDGICQKDSSGKEILESLFVEYKKLFERLSQVVDGGNAEEKSSQATIQALKEERKQLKRKVEEALSKVNEKDSELKVIELSLKRQIEELLSEKKNAFLEMQQSMDDSETYKEEVVELRTTLQSVRETLSKKNAELNITQESLTSANNEMQLLDAEYGKMKRNAAVKDAEVSRLQQDLQVEQEKYKNERDQAQKFSEDVIEKMRQLSENEKTKSMLQEKVRDVEQELESLQQKNNRVSIELQKTSEDKEDLFNELMELKSLCVKHESVIATLKTQNTSLEESLQTKIQSTTNSSLQHERLNTELSVTRHLLTEEEKKTSEQDAQIDELTKEIAHQTGVLNESRQQNNELKQEIKRLRELLSQKADTPNSIEVQNNELKEELQRLKEMLSQQADAPNPTQQQNAELKEELQYLKEMLSRQAEIPNESQQQQQQNNELKMELQSLKEMLSRKQNEPLSQPVALATADMKELEQLRMLNKELSDDQKRWSKSQEVLNNSLVEEISQRKATQEESTRLKERLNEKEEIIRELKSQINESNKQIEQDELQITELHNAISSNEKELVKLEAENKKLQREIEITLQAMKNVDDNIPALSVLDEKAEDGQDGVLIRSLDDMLQRIQDNKKQKELKAIEETIVADSERQTFAANDGFHEDLDWLLENTDVDGKPRRKQQIDEEEAKPLQEQQQQLHQQQQQHVQQLEEQQKQLETLENEKNQYWKDSLQKDGEIKTLNKSLDQLTDEKKALEEQIQQLEKKVLEPKQNKIPLTDAIEEELNATQEQLQLEREEKDEAVDCLKALVVDNEAYEKCIRDQRQLISALKKENRELSRKMNDTMDAFDREHEESSKTKQRLQNVMETTLSRESNLFMQQKHEIERLKLEMENLKNERQQLKIQLEDKKYELDKTNEDLSCLKSSIDYNLGGMDAEKRTKDYVEEQLRLVILDRGQTLQRLKSTELLNKMLQNKIKELQKWHNQIEVNLIKSCDYQVLPTKLVQHNLEIPSPTPIGITKLEDT